MKKFLSFALCLTMTLCLAGCSLFKSQKALITVNGSAITQKDFDNLYNKQVQDSIFAQSNVNLEDPKNRLLYLIVKDKVVNELIIREIIDQEIDNHKIKVTNKELNSEIERTYKEVGGKKAFKELLKNYKVTEGEFRADLKDGMLINKLIAKVNPMTKVSDSAARKFYNEHREKKFKRPKMVRASHILFMANKYDLMNEIKKQNKNIPEDKLAEKVEAKMAEVKTKAEAVLKKLKANPAGFDDAVVKYSEDLFTKTKKGDLDFFLLNGELAPEFTAAAFKTKPSLIHPELVQTDFGFHIIKVTDKKEAGIVPFDEVKNDLKVMLENRKKTIAFEKYIDSRKAKAVIKFKDPEYDPMNITKELKSLTQDFTKSPEVREVIEKK